MSSTQFAKFKQHFDAADVELMAGGRDLFMIKKNGFEKPLSETYLQNLSEEVNPIFNTNRTYDCKCCKDVIDGLGSCFRVSNEGVMTNIWSIMLEKDLSDCPDFVSAIKSNNIAHLEVLNKAFTTRVLFDIVRPFYVKRDTEFRKETSVRRYGAGYLNDAGKPSVIGEHATIEEGVAYEFTHLNYDKVDMKYHVDTRFGKDRYVAKVQSFMSNMCQIFGTDFELTPENIVACSASKDISSLSIARIPESTFETALAAIDDLENPLYRGEEYRDRLLIYIDARKKLKAAMEIYVEKTHGNFCGNVLNVIRAKQLMLYPILVTFPNSPIGEFLKNIAAKDLRQASAIFTDMMKNKGVTTKAVTDNNSDEVIEQLEVSGHLTPLTNRAHVAVSDIPVEGIVWRNEETAKPLSAVEKAKMLARTKSVSRPKKALQDEITIDDFVETVVPTAVKIGLSTDGLNSGQFCSMFGTSLQEDHPKIFAYDNPYCITFRDGTADAIIREVTKAGGDTSGKLHVSIAWCLDARLEGGRVIGNTGTDYDLWSVIMEPGTSPEKATEVLTKSKRERAVDVIYFGSRSTSSGHRILDVDANSRGNVDSRMPVPVENMNFSENALKSIGASRIFFFVNNWRDKNKGLDKITLVTTLNGERKTFHSEKGIKDKELMSIGYADVHANGEVSTVSINTSFFKEGEANITSWGVKLGGVVPVTLITKSPSHWDGESCNGNLIYMFALAGCKADIPLAGVHNEYLHPDIHSKRRVIQNLIESSKVEPTEDQTSGIGFSTTRRPTAVVEVIDIAGKKRDYKIRF